MPPPPSRPFTRSFGAIDTFVARTLPRHGADEATPGIVVDVSGWIIDVDRTPVQSAWLSIGNAMLPIELNRKRLDVAQMHRTQRTSAKNGFESSVLLPANIEPGLWDVVVVGQRASGDGIYGEFGRRVRIAHAPCSPRSFRDDSNRGIGLASLRLRGTQAWDAFRPARPHTVSVGRCLRLTGRHEAGATLHVHAQSTRELVAWEFACGAGGLFDATLWTTELEQGLYQLLIGQVRDDASVEPLMRADFAIAALDGASPPTLQPLFTRPDARVTTFGGPFVRPYSTTAAHAVAGRPLAIAGWCIDPAANEPPLAVYAQLDSAAPLRLTHNLPDPQGTHGAMRCGFGGIIDTAGLPPGPHRVRILAAAVSGAGWYVVDERTIKSPT